MDLSIRKLSKSFNQKVVFTALDFEIPSGTRLAIAGPNGSGKSTLLKIISGGVLPSSGNILYTWNNMRIEEDRVFKFIHFVAPYNTVIEELTLPELFKLHRDLGALRHFENYQFWSKELAYSFHPDHRIKTYSSGMKQRIKLGLTILDRRPLMLLDEPTSNLDAQGKEWFFEHIRHLKSDQTLIIATNDEEEKSVVSKS